MSYYENVSEIIVRKDKVTFRTFDKPEVFSRSNVELHVFSGIDYVEVADDKVSIQGLMGCRVEEVGEKTLITCKGESV